MFVWLASEVTSVVHRYWLCSLLASEIYFVSQSFSDAVLLIIHG